MASIIDRLLNRTKQDTPVIVENADSKGVIADYVGYMSSRERSLKSSFGYSARFDPAKVLKIVRNDPVVRAAIITLVDKVVESGWRLEGVDKRSRNRTLESKLRELRFDQLIRKIVFNMVMYNNAFVEIRPNAENLNLLETEFTRITAQDNGDIIGYYQEARGDSKSRPTWEPDEIAHFKLDDFTTNVWSEPNIEAIYETILIKDAIRVWLRWFFETNQLRPVMSVENVSGIKFKEFISYVKSAEQHVGKPIVVEGNLTVSKLQSFADEGKTVLEVLQWCDNQIRMLLQVPPLAVGITDTSGRSDGAEQRQYLNTRIYNIQRILEDEITFDLFPKMGWGKVNFRFGVLDETVRTRVFETVQMMRNSMFTEEAIIEYLNSQGVVFETDKPLLSQEDIQQMSNKDLGTGNEGMKGNVSTDAAQSRKRQNEGDLSKKNQSVQVKQ